MESKNKSAKCKPVLGKFLREKFFFLNVCGKDKRLTSAIFCIGKTSFLVKSSENLDNFVKMYQFCRKTRYWFVGGLRIRICFILGSRIRISGALEGQKGAVDAQIEAWRL